VGQVIAYTTAAKDACSDTVAWLHCLSRDAALQACSELDLQLLAVFRMVRQDTVVFLEHINDLLDEIGRGSLDEKAVQDELGHWRSLLGRFLRELLALDRSISEFFLFPYENENGGPPRQLTAALADCEPKSTARPTHARR
jgi:hypothetical protein